MFSLFRKGKSCRRMELEESSSAGTSLFQLIIALIMLGIGHSYSDDCNNGATKYLVTGGWTIVAFNILPFILTIVKIFALADGVISRSENFVIKTLGCIQKCLPLISFVVTIWVRNGTWVFFVMGSIVLPFITFSRVPSWCSLRTALGLLMLTTMKRLMTIAPSLPSNVHLSYFSCNG